MIIIIITIIIIFISIAPFLLLNVLSMLWS